ncbi:thiamine pyrophosphate-binding protein [Salipiger abyssi]|uniref:thiamine pyrophosphate-binding protein n=1 Tax=Salipiger abyssi TaxID=1250539 RepID=UPI001A8D6D65|nr:thiamine pyrophosphate-binding protein [Salipiger abyssi]MBN9885853.1 thiamine pyrophosphate-binding protein [Salipiger abyssi]
MKDDLSNRAEGRLSNDTVTGAEAAVLSLAEHGVSHVFGLCGDTSLPFYDALARLNHGITHILSRDERSAAYMADAYARVTGKVGVCEGPSGGGATYILPGVIEANESSSAMVCITSDVPVTARGRYPLTELDQTAMFRPLTKAATTIDHVDLIPDVFRKSFRAATTGRPGAAHIALPYDLQKQTLDPAKIWALPRHGAYPAYRAGPEQETVEEAAEVIMAAKNPVFIVGGGVISSGAMEELEELATLLKAPVASTVSGHGAISDMHPLAVGVVGANGGTDATREVVQGADCVIFVGCRAGSTTTEHGTVPGRNVPVVHIDLDPMVVGANYRCDAGIVADAKLALAALIDTLKDRDLASGGALAATLDAMRAKKWERFNQLAQSTDTPIRPERLLAALQAHMPEDGVIVADPGTPCPYFSGYYRLPKAGRHFITNRAHGALGFSLAAGIGAWYGRPDTTVVSVMGDGSFGFAVGEMETLTRMNVPLKMIVISNSCFGWIKASQNSGYGSRYFSVDFSQTDHARIAEGYGIKSWTVSDPTQVDQAVKEALAHDGPALVDIVSQTLQETNVPVSAWMG